ncbi:MAG: DUF6438 domain-containing protein [Bacteroidota bacterium]|uniref:DUF6438 domain-containing protein n=1 Tax=Runella sp. TaxID=1960881 RepID=UPI00301ADE9B
MKILNYCLAGTLICCLAACHRAMQQPATTVITVVEATAPVRKDTVVVIPDLVHNPVLEMSKTPCFGSCPVFVVKVYANGVVQWEGTKNVSRHGKFTAFVPADWIADVIKTAENQGFYKMAHRYPANGIAVPDLPQTTITISSQERGQYSVANAADAPLSLLQLQRDIEEKLETLDWRRVQ